MWTIRVLQYYSRLSQIPDYSNKYLENFISTYIMSIMHSQGATELPQIKAPNSKWEAYF